AGGGGGFPMRARSLSVTLVLVVAAGAAVAGAALGADGGGDAAELECLALNIYWEARSESPEDQAAVAHVTLNRVASPDFPDTICGVVQEGGETEGECQFSWWCDGTPDLPENREAWAEAERVARSVLSGATGDPTGGALYYHLDDVSPDWAAEKQRLAVIGPHVFYK
ncbi:MAG TPA: cell wall hydrolase, partial [Alphaproteobacteria bacterium]|nr:cell wall hydrolase [Alphaproteobacteria bacterium]